MENLETKVEQTKEKSRLENVKEYVRGCIDPKNARLYGNFQERASLNITQFPKIQGSLLIRMGMVYPIMSYLTEQIGIPKDCHTDILGMTMNYHTWMAGYLAYVAEIQAGLSKYPIEFAMKAVSKIKECLTKK